MSDIGIWFSFASVSHPLSLVTKPEIVFENKMLDKYAHAIPRCMHLCKMFVLFDIETILFTFCLFTFDFVI